MKYSFNELPSLALTITLAAVFFVVAIIIMTALGNNSNFTTPARAVNESFTMPADEGTVQVANGYTLLVVEVLNATNTKYPAANYTLSNTGVSTGGIITFHENATVCKTGATCRVTYTYTSHATSSGTTITNSLTALSEIPNNWFLLMVVVLIAAIIIGIVISNMGGSVGRE